MSRYAVKDPVATLVGEGARAGAKVVAVGFSDCNLWNGKPLHRDAGAAPCSEWCDADFRRGTPMTADDLLGKLGDLWQGPGERWVLLTGGEPTLQLDRLLVIALHQYGWKIAVETNGSVECAALDACDHVVVSPKLHTDFSQPKVVHEVRVTLPGAAPGQEGWDDASLVQVEKWFTDRWPSVPLYVSPQDPIVDPSLVGETALRRSVEVPEDRELVLDAQLKRNLGRCMAFVNDHPRWSFAAPVGRMLGFP